VAYRTYCRVAAVVFLLFTAYPVVIKVIEDRLSHDWLHSTLHLVSAATAAYAGWFARSETPARLFTWGVAVVYGVLGVVGWFIDGLLLNSHLAIPLGPVDNVFHLGLAAFALTTLIRTPAARRSRPTVAS
jgi:hypothetical protein